MSESESIASRSLSGGVPRTAADELLPDLTARANPEREGLPRNYRMRADAHYVDQLEAPAQPAIRMVKTSQIECRDVPPPENVESLTQSIAMHGILQPLLVRRQGGRYSIIAGRKRLAAAIAAGLASVPCALHEVDGAAAAARATARTSSRSRSSWEAWPGRCSPCGAGTPSSQVSGCWSARRRAGSCSGCC